MNPNTVAINLCRVVGKSLKPLLRCTIYRPGSVATIFRGPSKGLRYHMYPEFGLAHLYGGWEPEVLDLLSRIVKPGYVVYDVGANYGLHSLLMARCVGPTGKVFAFEPMPDICAAAAKNRNLNGFAQIELVPEAISNVKGITEFVIGHHEGAGHLSTAGRGNAEETERGRRVSVMVTTIDDFIAEGKPEPDLLKIDIEGAESAALQGAKKTLTTKRPKLMIELHTPEQDRLVGSQLLAAGYCAFRVEEHGLPAVKNMNNGHPDPDGMRGYILAVHADQLVNGRPPF